MLLGYIVRRDMILLYYYKFEPGFIITFLAFYYIPIFI